MIRGLLSSLFVVALFVTLGEGAEAPKAQSPKGSTTSAPLRDPEYFVVATMTNNNQKYPAMIYGDCFQRGATKLECKLIQIRFALDEWEKDSYNLHIDVFSPTFTRISENGQWVSREGPDSACGRVDISTLEPGGGGSFNWTFTSNQIYTDRSGPLCEKLPREEIETFSWKNPPVMIGGKKIRVRRASIR
jgi:hypothetical protein